MAGRWVMHQPRIRYERKDSVRRDANGMPWQLCRAVCVCGWVGCWYSDSGDAAEQSAAMHRERGCKECK